MVFEFSICLPSSSASSGALLELLHMQQMLFFEIAP